jgi:hypothetical protein
MTASNPIQLALLFRAEVAVAPAVELGAGTIGIRRMVPILAGSFEGPRMKGTIPAGGADWQMIRSDGVTEIEAHYTLETEDRVIIRVVNRGYRHGPPEVMRRLALGDPVDPSEYYFRAAPSFEAPLGRYQWLNQHLFVSTGRRLINSVQLDFYQIL